MPKGKLEFNLPEEAEEFKWAQRGMDYLAALEDMRELLRKRRKYVELPEAVAEEVAKIEKEFFEILKDREISFD